MAGRHSKRSAHARLPEQQIPTQRQRASRLAGIADALISGWFHWHRSSAQVVVPTQRLPGVEVVDARTKVAHQVSPEELWAGRTKGDYQGFCGVRFLAASMVEPIGDRCPRCAS